MNKQFFVLAECKSFDRKERTVTAWASQAIIDRDKELILASAWQKPGATDAFEKHPVLLIGHRYGDLPLGKVIKLDKTNKGLKFTAKFASTASAIEAFDLIVELGGIAAFSVGFIPKAWEEILAKDLRAAGYDIGNIPETDKIMTFTDVELLEISLVSIPANPAATAVGAAYTAGRVKTKELSSAIEEYLEITDDGEIETGEDLGAAISAYLNSVEFKAHLDAAVSSAVAGLQGKARPSFGERIPDFANEEERLAWLDNLLYSRLKKRFDRDKLRSLALKTLPPVKPFEERLLEKKRQEERQLQDELEKIKLEHIKSEITLDDIKKIVEEKVSLAIDKMRGIVR